MTERKTTANSTFAIGGVSSPLDSFVVAESSVLRTNFCAEKPAHRQSAKRYVQPKGLQLILTKMTKNNLFLFIGLLFSGCIETNTEHDNYPKDTITSNSYGEPKDSLTFYYPTSISRDSQAFKTNIDTFKLNWYSSALFCADEPILFNYYQGHDIYRFLWLRSFHRPMIFSLHKEADKVWLTTKELNKQPNFLDMTYVKFVPPTILENGEIDTTAPTYGQEPPIDSVVKADRKANIILNQTKQLTIKEWTEFETLLNACSFWTTEPYKESSGLDGSEWTIEGHLKSKYWFVNRWSPKDGFRKVGEYLIEKSGINEEIY